PKCPTSRTTSVLPIISLDRWRRHAVVPLRDLVIILLRAVCVDILGIVSTVTAGIKGLGAGHGVLALLEVVVVIIVLLRGVYNVYDVGVIGVVIVDNVGVVKDREAGHVAIAPRDGLGPVVLILQRVVVVDDVGVVKDGGRRHGVVAPSDLVAVIIIIIIVILLLLLRGIQVCDVGVVKDGGRWHLVVAPRDGLRSVVLRPVVHRRRGWHLVVAGQAAAQGHGGRGRGEGEEEVGGMHLERGLGQLGWVGWVGSRRWGCWLTVGCWLAEREAWLGMLMVTWTDGGRPVRGPLYRTSSPMLSYLSSSLCCWFCDGVEEPRPDGWNADPARCCRGYMER
ncbi:uncharacterized protein B0H64DRAFT_215311, partial [Chaetomium fimeti]